MYRTFYILEIHATYVVQLNITIEDNNIADITDCLRCTQPLLCAVLRVPRLPSHLSLWYEEARWLRESAGKDHQQSQQVIAITVTSIGRHLSD